ncbi:MAG: hypothetical protein JWR49_3832 [Tardiphaga sp.]|jgi:hypothetical protein|nr:hypothetical protein [Tardiphaga sp.]
MFKTIGAIVAAYAKLGDALALENLKAERQHFTSAFTVSIIKGPEQPVNTSPIPYLRHRTPRAEAVRV